LFVKATILFLLCECYLVCMWNMNPVMYRAWLQVELNASPMASKECAHVQPTLILLVS